MWRNLGTYNMKCQMVCKLRLHDSSKDGLNRQKWTTLIYENSGRFQVEVGDTRSSWELPGRAGSSQGELGPPRASWDLPGRGEVPARRSIPERRLEGLGDLQREQRAKYLFFGLKGSSHTNIFCFYIAFSSTGRNPARRRAAGGGPPSCWVAIW